MPTCCGSSLLVASWEPIIKVTWPSICILLKQLQVLLGNTMNWFCYAGVRLRTFVIGVTRLLFEDILSWTFFYMITEKYSGQDMSDAVDCSNLWAGNSWTSKKPQTGSNASWQTVEKSLITKPRPMTSSHQNKLTVSSDFNNTFVLSRLPFYELGVNLRHRRISFAI